MHLNHCVLSLLCISILSIDIEDIMVGETLPFFDLADIPGVKELSRQQDSNSEAIEVPDIGVFFGDELVKKAYVRVVYACMCIH